MSTIARRLPWLVLLAFAGSAAAAPVPPEPPPDPLARGYLGITVQNGLAIAEVYPGLPASRAGLREGDRIVRVGTLEPQTFEQVVAHICNYRPGTIVELEVARGSERHVVRITLAVRPPEADNPNRNYPVPIFPPDR